MAPGLLFCVIFTWRAGYDSPEGRQFTLLDDAMISMAYARTLAETGELVWFPGADRVQGFSNPLWTLYLALLHRIGLVGSAAALAVTLSGIAILVATALLAARLVYGATIGLPAQRTAAAAAAGAILLLYPLVFWTLRGMEVGLIALLCLMLLAGVGRALQDWPRGASGGRGLALFVLAASLGVATRLDFVVFAAPLGVLLLIWAPDWPARLRAVLLGLAPFLLTGVLVLIWQWDYYGDWLPNTYQLKLGDVPLVERLDRGVASAGKSVAVIGMAGLGLVASLRSAASGPVRRKLAAALVLTLAAAAYSVWVGGDVWEFFLFINRFVAAVLPVCVVLVISGAARLLASSRPALVPRTLAAGALGAILLGAPAGWATDPSRLLLFIAALSAATLAAAGLLAWMTLWDARRSNATSRIANTAFLGSVATAIVLACSLVGGGYWVGSNAHEVNVQRERTLSALELSRITAPEALVGTYPAGALGYYVGRRLVDMLGVNDRIVASGPRRNFGRGEPLLEVAFYPGHDKEDFAHSLGTLRPDLIFEAPVAEDQGISPRLVAYGYVRRCLAQGGSMYVKLGTTRVDWGSLFDCAKLPANR